MLSALMFQIGIDFSECSDRVLAVVRMQFPTSQRRLLPATAKLPAMIPAMSSALDLPAELPLAEVQSWSADLIALGTHGQHGMDHALSGSERAVRDATVPVLIVGRLTAPTASPEPANLDTPCRMTPA